MTELFIMRKNTLILLFGEEKKKLVYGEEENPGFITYIFIDLLNKFRELKGEKKNCYLTFNMIEICEEYSFDLLSREQEKNFLLFLI